MKKPSFLAFVLSFMLTGTAAFEAQAGARLELYGHWDRREDIAPKRPNLEARPDFDRLERKKSPAEIAKEGMDMLPKQETEPEHPLHCHIVPPGHCETDDDFRKTPTDERPKIEFNW
jgi:hypothetical protein